jgi:TetR/AcrR family transcriptional regulator
MSPLSPVAAAARHALLDAAERGFAERGFAGASTRQIAASAGVSQPLLLHYFGSKRELFDAVLERAVASFDEALAPQWPLPADQVEFFVRGLQVVFDWVGQRPELVRLVSWARLEGSWRMPESWVAAQQRVAERVREAQRAGVVRAELDVDVALLVIDNALKGYWDRRAEYLAAGLGGEDLDARYRRTALRMLLPALLEPEHHERALAWT